MNEKSKVNDPTKLNGSVDLLADAMRQVFSEAVQEAVDPLTTEVKAMRSDVNDLKKENQTTRENVHAQLAEHRKEVRKIISDRK